MTDTKTEDKLADAKRQGQAQFESIREMVAVLNRDADAGREAIEQDALSVQVRSGWYNPGVRSGAEKPQEYEILLCTGGPACRIIGELDDFAEPSTAVMQVQDWFQPWADFYPKGENVEETLLGYASVFYYAD